MSRWSIEYETKAFTDLKKLDRPIRRHIIDWLEWFASHFDDVTPAPLHGEWRGFFKSRIGDWRVVYVFEPSSYLIKVFQIDRRDKVYKRRS